MAQVPFKELHAWCFIAVLSARLMQTHVSDSDHEEYKHYVIMVKYS